MQHLQCPQSKIVLTQNNTLPHIKRIMLRKIGDRLRHLTTPIRYIVCNYNAALLLRSPSSSPENMVQEKQHRTRAHTHQNLGCCTVSSILFTVTDVKARHVEFLAVRILFVIRAVPKNGKKSSPKQSQRNKKRIKMVREVVSRDWIESASSE